jgi:hypothetical protein
MSTSILTQFASFVGKLLFITCLLVGTLGYTLVAWKSLRRNWMHVRRLHQIPCSNCIFFTGDYKLKCAVHPCKALTEEAIGCTDYQMAKKSSINGKKI